ncbi:hypothetical protein ACIPW5_26125 [Streptomyces sp. NPDC090077]|uniref:hypothetical protein n=1 Tax=Streptomyces sp. NPDC090077 TaxID=3365938 RepID=UPI0037FF4B31
MDTANMPAGLVSGIHASACEAVRDLTDALRYAQGNSPFNVPRMVLYRLGDAIDTLSQITRVITLHYRQNGWAEQDLTSYLQPRQERPRTGEAAESDHHYLAGLLGRPCPSDNGSPTGLYDWGRMEAENPNLPEVVNTLACLYALRAAFSEEPEAVFADLDEPTRTVARGVAQHLLRAPAEEPCDL